VSSLFYRTILETDSVPINKLEMNCSMYLLCTNKLFQVISWQCVINFIFIHRLILRFGDVANLRNQKTEHTL
jgi:hypothetical protein